MNRSILPARSLRLTGRFHARQLLIVFLELLVMGLFALATWWVAVHSSDIGRDKALWAKGVSADGNIDGTRQSKLGLSWFISAYSGKVTYTDAAGQTHHGEFDFWTMLGGPDTDTAELRYDAEHPDRFAISWAVDASGARWRATIVIGGLALGFTLFMAGAIWLQIGEHRAFSRIATRGDEVELRIASRYPVPQDKRGWWRHHFELANGDKPHSFIRDLPSVFESSPDRALALWMPGDTGNLLVLHADLTPLQLTSEEQQHAKARAGHSG